MHHAVLAKQICLEFKENRRISANGSVDFLHALTAIYLCLAHNSAFVLCTWSEFDIAFTAKYVFSFNLGQEPLQKRTH